MRFGAAIPNYGKAELPGAMIRVAQAAEAAGFDSVWTSDHVLVPQRHGPVFGRTIEPLLALGYLAGVTRRVRLGTSIVILPQRDPILLAKQAAGVDQLSGGRLTLGVGVGWMREQSTYFRTDFAQRGRVADEWLRAMRVLWTENPCAFHGEFINFEDAYFEPKPVQPGGPLVVVGGASAAALRRAATLGDGWHASALSVAEFGLGVKQLRAMSEGRALAISLRAYAAVGRHAEARKDSGDLLVGGPSAAFVERIGEYEEAGLEEFVCGFAYDTVDDIVEQLEMFAAEVMPQMRG